uniref:Uncharacterized protein n=1 Tax=Populus trichocarpa TaxID=3694 RepID=B9HZY5_POPTR
MLCLFFMIFPFQFYILTFIVYAYWFAAKAAFGTSVDYNTTFFDIAEVYESMVLVATKYAELPCMKASSLKCSNCL